MIHVVLVARHVICINIIGLRTFIVRHCSAIKTGNRIIRQYTCWRGKQIHPTCRVGSHTVFVVITIVRPVTRKPHSGTDGTGYFGFEIKCSIITFKIIIDLYPLLIQHTDRQIVIIIFSPPINGNIIIPTLTITENNIPPIGTWI
ncbi:hypothetical protein D3C81_1068100 [compost metagenome]